MTKFQWAVIGILTVAVIGVFCVLAWLVVVSTPTLIAPARNNSFVIATVTPYMEPLTLRPQPTPTFVRVPTRTVMNIPPRRTYNHSFRIQEEYDKFKGTTVYTLWPSASAFQPGTKPNNLMVFYSYDGMVPKPPQFVDFGLTLTSTTWRYLSCYSTYILLDGSRVLNPTAKHIGQVLSSANVFEIISTTLTLEDFLLIVNSQKVEIKVCNDEFALTSDQMEALRDLASRMNP